MVSELYMCLQRTYDLYAIAMLTYGGSTNGVFEESARNVYAGSLSVRANAVNVRLFRLLLGVGAHTVSCKREART